MASNAQSFQNAVPIVFTAFGTDSAGNLITNPDGTSTLDQTQVTLSFAVGSGTPGTFAGNTLTPTADATGVGTVSGTFQTYTNTDVVTITDTISGIQVVGK